MKAEARQVHVLWPRRVIERAQNVGDPPCILHAEPASIARPEEPFQGLVFERPDHARNVRRHLTTVKTTPYENLPSYPGLRLGARQLAKAARFPGVLPPGRKIGGVWRR